MPLHKGLCIAWSIKIKELRLRSMPLFALVGTLSGSEKKLLLSCTKSIAGHTFEEVHKWQNSSFCWITICKWIKVFSDIFGLTKRKRKEYSEANGRDLLRYASEIAPVVMSLGNHEWYLTDKDIATIRSSNAILLNNSDDTYNVKNNDILFGGLSTKCDFEWLDTFSKKTGIKVLLCHHPEYYIKYIKGTYLDTFDLVISGHAHGGQWRFFNKGIFAPGQGFFPKYTKGVYGKMIVSAGLSNTAIVPRFNNPKEVVFIECYGK